MVKNNSPKAAKFYEKTIKKTDCIFPLLKLIISILKMIEYLNIKKYHFLTSISAEKAIVPLCH